MKKRQLWNLMISIGVILAIYLTIAVVAAFIILDQIAGAIEDSTTIFGTWWQTLLFVLDVLAVGAAIFGIVMRVRTKEQSPPIKGVLLKIFNKTVWSSLTAFFSILLCIVFIGTSIANQYSAMINSRLGINLYEIVQVDENEEVDTNYYKSDYYLPDGSFDNQSMRQNSLDVAERSATESTVLLWNKDNALPLKQDSYVGIFGVSAQNYLVAGTGSGAMNNVSADTIYSMLTKSGINVYSKLWSAYKLLKAQYSGWCQVSSEKTDVMKEIVANGGEVDTNYGEYLINEAPWSAIDSNASLGKVTEDYSKYKDAAIMVISRNGGETRDTNFKAKQDNCLDDYNYMDLSANEADILSHLSDLKEQGKINHIIVLLNAANAIQLGNIVKYNVDACLWTGLGGQKSFAQIANVLTGKDSPSGHLVDTYVYDTDSAPATENFGDYTYTKSAGTPKTEKYSWNSKYVVYQEGIYVGYLYYETRYEDYVMKSGNADSAKGVKYGSGSWNYNDEVAYTFGHGLSYTQFEYSDYKVEHNKKTDKYEVSMTITNVGDTYSGKEVMQIYLQKPYTAYDIANKIEKASVQLVGFAKTNNLAPGEKQTLIVEVDAYEFKCYDAYNKGTYILEKGDYYLAAGNSAHGAINNILAAKGYGVSDGMDEAGNASLVKKITVAADDFEKYSVSSVTGKKVGNLFDDVDINRYSGTADQQIKYLSRSDWDATYPSAAVLTCENRQMVADMQYGVEPDSSSDRELPKYSTVSEKYGPLTLLSMQDVDYYNTELWDAFMDQTTWEEQSYLVTYGSHVFAGAASVAAPGGFSQNGPSGIKPGNQVSTYTQMIFPCEVNMAATWNIALIEEMGNAFGMEMLHVDYEGINAPGANIHRTAYSGRNWEYYSEDGFLSGRVLAAQSTGMMNRGCILFTKHFLLNDQERNRYGVSVWCNEQALREVYAKAYEYAVTDAKLNGVMSSFNRIGCTWTGRHQGLLTGLLRDEWGFTGMIESDAAVGTHMTHYLALANAVVAGQDLWMLGGSETCFNGYKDNPTVAWAVREGARRVLYTQLHSSAVNGLSASTKVVMIKPWWQTALVVAEIIVSIVTALVIAGTVTACILNRKKKEIKE